MAQAVLSKKQAQRAKRASMKGGRPLPPASLSPSTAARVLTIVLMIIALFYFLFPIYWLVVSSSKSNSELVSTSGMWFAHVDWAGNYDKLQAWTHGHFWRWVINSLVYSTVAGVFGTLLSVAAGYGLAKFRFPGRRVVLAITMGGLLMPIALLTVPLYLMFHHLHITNTMISIIIPSCVSPFGVFLGWVYAQQSVPSELIEAARIDGASEARIFFTMVTRLLAPAMVTIFLFIFVATWNNFLLPLMMVSSDSIKPITLGLYGMMSYFAPQRGAIMLGALLGVIPLIVLFLVLQKYWRAGLAAGSVKG